ncbi:hypothetical protein BCS42_04940 [Crenothrix sp. D3]|nr:hypothetical protein BCS42_04940 [Crenothrix sp. D3]
MKHLPLLSLLTVFFSTNTHAALWFTDQPADKAMPAKQSTSKTKADSQASDETDKQAVKGLEEMVVSATKTETLLSNALAAVSVVTQKDMESKNISRLGDALIRVPSLFLGFNATGQTQGASGSGGFSLRGVDTRRTLVLVDGQPLQDVKYYDQLKYYRQSIHNPSVFQ